MNEDFINEGKKEKLVNVLIRDPDFTKIYLNAKGFKEK